MRAAIAAVLLSERDRGVRRPAADGRRGVDPRRAGGKPVDSSWRAARRCDDRQQRDADDRVDRRGRRRRRSHRGSRGLRAAHARRATSRECVSHARSASRAASCSSSSAVAGARRAAVPSLPADRCGGCQLQHLGYDAQLAAKRAIIRDALRRIGRARRARSGGRAERRCSGDIGASSRCICGATGAGWVAGLHPYDDPVGVFDLADCPITDERVLDVWRGAAGRVRRTSRRTTRCASRSVCSRTGRRRRWREGDVWPTRGSLLRRRARRSRSCGGGPTKRAMRRVASRSVESRAGAVVRCRSTRASRARSTTSVIDARSGARPGAAGRCVRRQRRHGHSAGAGRRTRRRDRARSRCRRSDARESRCRRHRAIAGRVEDHLERALPADVVLLNPPRAGVIHAWPTRSSDIARAARPLLRELRSGDARARPRATARISSRRVRGFDMFPQTAHVETVCELVPNAA